MRNLLSRSVWWMRVPGFMLGMAFCLVVSLNATAAKVYLESELQSILASKTLPEQIEFYLRLDGVNIRLHHEYFKKTFQQLSAGEGISNAKVNLLHGKFAREEKKHSEAIHYYQKAYADGSGLNFEDSVLLTNELMLTYISVQALPLAIEMQDRLVRDFGGRPEMEAFPWMIRFTESMIYYRMELYERAALSLKKELAGMKKDSVNISLYCSGFNNLGFYWFKAGEEDSALFYYNKAILLANQHLGESAHELVDVVKSNIAQIDMQHGRWNDALPPLLFTYRKSSRNLAYIEAISDLNYIIQSYIKMERQKLAATYLDSARLLLPHFRNTRHYLSYLKKSGIL